MGRVEPQTRGGERPGASGSGASRDAARGLRNNLARWRSGDYVASYGGDALTPAERHVLSRYRTDLSGRILELGCGAGRLTGHVIGLAQETHGMDISPAMVQACRERLPGGVFVEGDIRDLSAYGASRFDAVIAAYNTLDELDPPGREQAIDEAARVLRPHGLFYMSAHNQYFLPRIKGPVRFSWRTPRDLAANLFFTPRRIRNHLRLRRLQRVESDYALINDNAHDYALLHYYITPQAQVKQLEARGFAVLEVLDLDCCRLGPEESAERHVFLHYVARRNG